MKKSIFLTAMMTLTVLSAVFGQATHYSDSDGISCTDDALHPIAGKTYSYTATVSPDGGTAKWWTTKDVNFISAGTDNSSTALSTPNITAVSNYNTSATVSGGNSEMDLIWGTDILAGTASGTTSATFVVVKYDAPSGSCADNLKVYQIDPINAFTVDVLNMTNSSAAADTSGTYGDTYSSCVSDVKNAAYNASTNKVEYNYGDNELYFEVVAANFTGSYIPTFQLTGLQAGQTADIEWGYTTGTYGNSLETGITGGSTFSKTSTTAVTTNETDTSAGVSIFVKVTVHNGTYETLTQQQIDLAVTGQNTAGQSDVTKSDCDVAATFADNNLATQYLNPRPTVNDATDDGDFIPASN